MEDGARPSEMRSLVRRLFQQQSRQPMLAINLLQRHWPDVVGPELSARTVPRRLSRGVLWVTTPDACWAYELQFFKSELLASVQAFMESVDVREVRFEAGAAATAAPGGPPGVAPEAAFGGSRDGPEAGAGPHHPARAGHTNPARRSQQPEQPEPEAPEALDRAAQSIGDPALREVFRRSLAKQHRGRGRREP